MTSKSPVAQVLEKRKTQKAETSRSPDNKANQSGFGTFRESHLFKQAGNFYFQLDKNSQNLFDNKHMIKNSIAQIKFPSIKNKDKPELLDISQIARESANNLSISIREKQDNDLVQRQRTVNEWAQSINNYRMNIQESQSVQPKRDDFGHKRSSSTVSKSTILAQAQVQQYYNDRPPISIKLNESFNATNNQLKSRPSYLAEVDFDHYSFTNKNSSIIPHVADHESVFTKNSVFVPPKEDHVQISIDNRETPFNPTLLKKASKFTLRKVDTRSVLQSKKSLGITARNHSVTIGGAGGTLGALGGHIAGQSDGKGLRMSIEREFNDSVLQLNPFQSTLDSRREYLKNREQKSNSVIIPDFPKPIDKSYMTSLNPEEEVKRRYRSIRNTNSEQIQEPQLSPQRLVKKESYDLINCQKKDVLENTKHGRQLMISKFWEEEQKTQNSLDYRKRVSELPNLFAKPKSEFTMMNEALPQTSLVIRSSFGLKK